MYKLNRIIQRKYMKIPFFIQEFTNEMDRFSHLNTLFMELHVEKKLCQMY